MSIEDFSLALSLPGFVVLNPADEFATRALIHKAAEHKGGVYMRTGRPKAAMVHGPDTSFEICKGIKLRDGQHLTFVATGLLVYEALAAAETLAQEGIEASVIDIHTLKPLDEELLIQEARRTGHVVVAEEHQIWGGLGSAVATLLSRTSPCRMEFVAIQDTYAESGLPDELMEKYGLTAPSLVKAAKRVLGRS